MSDLRDMIATFLYTLEWGDDPSLDSVDIAPFLPDADKLLAGLKGTPLTEILDALGHTYQASIVAAMEVDVLGGPVSICYAMNPPLPDGAPVLVVDNPATDEAKT